MIRLRTNYGDVTWDDGWYGDQNLVDMILDADVGIEALTPMGPWIQPDETDELWQLVRACRVLFEAGYVVEILEGPAVPEPPEGVVA